MQITVQFGTKYLLESNTVKTLQTHTQIFSRTNSEGHV